MMPFLRKLMLPALAVFVLAAGQASAGDFVFRYKTGLISEAPGTPDPDPSATCQVGENGLPDCNGICEAGDEPGSVDCNGVCDAGEENAPDCKIVTVDGVPDWDGFSSTQGLSLVATVGSRDVGSSNLIYQCFKASGGEGNYQFWIGSDLGGDSSWIEAIDIVTRDKLATPVVGSAFSYGYLAPAFDSGINRLTVDHSGEACIRAIVKPDHVPAADAFVHLGLDDYPTSAVVGGTVDTNYFDVTERWAYVPVTLKPNCVSGCVAEPGPWVFSLEPDVTVTQKVSATSAYHLYNMEDVWNGAEMATGPVFIAKGGSFPYTIHANIGEGKWLARPGNNGECVISALTDVFGLSNGDPSPGSINRSFTGNLSVTEAGGEEKHYAINFDYQAVEESYLDGGSTMNITIPDCNGEYGPDYVPPAPVVEVGIEIDPTTGDPGTAPVPLTVTATTHQNTGNIFWQCFKPAGGYGNYSISVGEAWFTNYPAQGDWQDHIDVVDPGSVGSPMPNSDAVTYPAPTDIGGGDTLYPTTNGEACVRVTPKADASGNRYPLGMVLYVQDFQAPDPVFGNASPPYTMVTKYFRFVPGGDGVPNPNDGDGVCEAGETGADCNGVCEMGESGSVDCGGGAAPVNDGDFVCEPGESGTDCDATCSPTEETSIDCPIPTDWVQADAGGYGSGPTQGTLSDSVFEIEPQLGYLELAPYAPLLSGGSFGYQCFYVSNGSWPNWQHWLYVSGVDGSFNWLTNLDLVYKSDLYFGTVAPFNGIAYHDGRQLPAGLSGTTTKTSVCARWIVQHPGPTDALSVPLVLESSNVDGNGAIDPVKRSITFNLTPR